MSSAIDLDGTVERFLEVAIRSDGPSAVRLTLDLLDQGASAAAVVGVLAAAQHESGERWRKNLWTVADEHVVSGVTQRSLDAVANSVESPPPSGSVVVACAEGDWHSLPSQMFAEVLRSLGFAVGFLGASTPSDHIARLLARDRPDALVLTCNLPLFFVGVATAADAAHRAGIPVIAGGRSLRTGPGRALRLGADSWAADSAAAIVQLRQWAEDPPIPSPEATPLDSVAMRLDLDSAQLASEAFDSMADSHRWMEGLNSAQQGRTKEDLVFIVRFIAAARLVDDPLVLMDFLDWLRSLLAARGVPTSALVAGLAAIAPLIENTDPEAGLLTRQALRQVSEDAERDAPLSGGAWADPTVS